MKFVKKKDKRSDLQKEYDNAVLLLKTYRPDMPEYEAQLKTVERLHKMLMDEEDRKQKVSWGDVLATAGNLAGIGLIVGYEHAHVIVSKALPFVFKTRIR